MRIARSAISTWLALLALAIGCAELHPAVAQESWNPFKSQSERERNRRPRADDGATPSPPLPRERPTVPASEQPLPRPPARGGVERSELAPIMAPDTSGLPLELWRGLDLKTLEGLLAGLELPPRSPAIHQLWRRLLLSTATPPAGAPNDEHFVALRLEALYRSGLLEDMDAVLKDLPAPGPVVEMLRARRDIGLGQRETGCQTIKALAAPSSRLPGRLKGETQLLAGYCAAVADDAHGAGLAVELAREEGVEAELPLAVLAAHAAGDKPRLTLPKRVLLLDYRFLELLGPLDPTRIFDKAEPALLVTLAGDPQSDLRLQIAAAEAALKANALSPAAVAKLYRSLSLSGRAAADPAAPGTDPLLRRALFFQAAEVARAPGQRARFLQAIIEDARRSGSFLQTAAVVAPLLAGVQPSRELSPYAQGLVEMSLAAGEFSQARQWAESADLWPWVALVDIADPERRGGRLRSLGAIEDLAVRGRLGPEALHKLATVLDALDIDVPIQIWDAANRTPQSSSGYLPETGILADLAQSSRRNDAGRTILLVMRTLGPGGPDGANLLALGDAIRALKRLGLEADARRLGLEALLPVWPRAAAN
ncbi:MAG: hypothetical protein ACAH24_04900 [Hyphomicrobiaceae bacterium]